MAITLSSGACDRVIRLTEDVGTDLLSNHNVMKNEVNSLFAGIQDPAIRKYLTLCEEAKETIDKIVRKMDDLISYCERVKRWIDSYNSL